MISYQVCCQIILPVAFLLLPTTKIASIERINSDRELIIFMTKSLSFYKCSTVLVSTLFYSTANYVIYSVNVRFLWDVYKICVILDSLTYVQCKILNSHITYVWGCEFSNFRIAFKLVLLFVWILNKILFCVKYFHAIF